MSRWFVVSRWWDHVYGWYLFVRRRPRCAPTPFEPPASRAARPTQQGEIGADQS